MRSLLRRTTFTRAFTAALLTGSVLGTGPATALASATAQGACDPAAADLAAVRFGGLSSMLGTLTGTPAACPTQDAAGNVIYPTTAGMFIYYTRQNLPVFTNGVEDWAWSADGVTFYAHPGATGEAVTPDNLTPGAPRLQALIQGDTAAPAAPAAPATEPAPVAPAAPAAPIAAPAPAASGVLGGTYEGIVQTRQKLTIQVSPDGKQIESISAQLWCTDMSNTSRTETITFAPNGPFPIGPDGKASFSGLRETLDSVAYTHFLDATFNGAEVTGTLKIQSFVSGAAYACNTSDLPFSATRK